MEVFAIAIKDLRLLVRDRMNFFFTFIFPMIFAVLFGMIFGGGGGSGEKSGVPIAVLNEDGGGSATEFVQDLGKDDSLRVTNVATREEGEAMVRKGDASACVVVPKGYSAAGLFSGTASKLDVLVDPSRSAEAGLLQGKLTEIAFRGIGRGFTDRARMLDMLSDARGRVSAMQDLNPAQRSAFEGMFGAADELQKQLDEDDKETKANGATSESDSGGVAWMPVKIDIHELAPKEVTGQPKSSFQISFTQSVVWGLVGCVAAFVSSLASERQQGTLGRLMSSPLAGWQVLTGKALACFVSCVIVQTTLLAAVMLFAKVVERKAFIVGDWSMLIVSILVTSGAFTGIMMAFAGFTKSEASAGGLARAVMLVLAMVGGGTVPLFLLPAWVQKVSVVNPFRWAVIALEGGVWRGMTWGEIMLPLGVLAALTVVGFGVGVFGMRQVRA